MNLLWQYLPATLTLAAVFSFLLYYGVLSGPLSFRKTDYAAILAFPLPAGLRETRLGRWNRIPAGAAAACVAVLFAEAAASWFLPHRWFWALEGADKAAFYGIPALAIAYGLAKKFGRRALERARNFWGQNLWPGLLLLVLAFVFSCFRIIR